VPHVVVVLLAAQTIAIAPLRIEHGTRGVELRADGTIVDSAGAEIGRIDGGEVWMGEMRLFRVDAAGVVRCAYFADEGRFDDDDALVFVAEGERRRYFIADDGAIALERPSGEVSPAGVRVMGVTRASRRAAVLVALSVLILERIGPLPRPHRVSMTLDVLSAAAGYFELASELRLDRRFSFALRAGGGSRWNHAGPRSSTTLAWEIGVEPRWFPGILGRSLYLGWSTRFARARTGAVGFESLQTPPGLSTGLLVGFKFELFGITPDFSAGPLFPLVVPANEVSHPPAALVMRAGFGFSF
jgi:hypothetical protein